MDTTLDPVDLLNIEVAHESWGLFDCDGSEYGPLQLQRFDDPDPLPDDAAGPVRHWDDDTDVWEYVRGLAEAGSAVHLRALALLREHNRQEYDRVMAWPD